MATYNQMQVKQQPKFSVAITTKGYQSLISNTLRDPARARRFTASITSAVAVNPALQECDAGTILAGALLGESLNLSPSPQLGQYYLVPFKQKAKYDRNNRLIRPESVTAQFVLGYKGYIQLALRSGQYKDLDVMVIKQGEYLGKDPETGKAKFQFVEDDDQRDALPTVGYMAYFEYLNGFRKALYWSKEKMMTHADTYSKAFSRKSYVDDEGKVRPQFPKTDALVTAPGCGHLMYGAITQINYGDTKHTTIASRRVPKFSLNQENDLRKTILKARPLAAPHNYCPWIRVKNVVG